MSWTIYGTFIKATADYNNPKNRQQVEHTLCFLSIAQLINLKHKPVCLFDQLIANELVMIISRPAPGYDVIISQNCLCSPAKVRITVTFLYLLTHYGSGLSLKVLFRNVKVKENVFLLPNSIRARGGGFTRRALGSSMTESLLLRLSAAVTHFNSTLFLSH